MRNAWIAIAVPPTAADVQEDTTSVVILAQLAGLIAWTVHPALAMTAAMAITSTVAVAPFAAILAPHATAPILTALPAI